MPSEPSKLEPHREFIAAERRKKTTYRRIAELLAEKGVQVDHSSIHAFVKVRSKPQRKVITMLEPRAEGATAATQNANALAEETRTVATTRATPERARQVDAIERLKRTKSDTHEPEKGLPSFREDGPLDQLSDEEARRYRDEL